MADKLKVLFLGARPRNAPALRLKEQVMKTQFQLGQSGHGERVDFQSVLTASFEDLPNLLMGKAPHVVHITGHSADNRQLALEDDEGRFVLIPPQALIDTFSTESVRRSIRCLVLNSCYSDETAKELSRYIDFVIGTRDEITQTAAIAFAQAFYPVLARGESLQDAFNIARAQFLPYMAAPGASAPVLYVRPGADPKKPFFPLEPDKVEGPREKRPLRIFILFAPAAKEDRPFYRELCTHLSLFQRQGQIEWWDVSQLRGGDDISMTIDRHLREAHIFLALVSASAMADRQWMSIAEQAMERHREGSARVVPILLRPAFTDTMCFSTLAMLPGNGVALSAFRDRDTQWTKILKQIL